MFVSLWLQCLKCCMLSLSVRIKYCCHRRRSVAAFTPIRPEPEPEVEWDIVEVSSESSSVAEDEFERRGATPGELFDTTVGITQFGSFRLQEQATLESTLAKRGRPTGIAEGEQR